MDDLIERIASEDHWHGYIDGKDIDAPWPSGNRSAEYRHSFEVGRAEAMGSPIPAAVSREKAERLSAIRALAEQGDG